MGRLWENFKEQGHLYCWPTIGSLTLAWIGNVQSIPVSWETDQNNTNPITIEFQTDRYDIKVAAPLHTDTNCQLPIEQKSHGFRGALLHYAYLQTELLEQSSH